MNAERLLQHYERIADAPDAIARLRRFILDLAVRGKLVPQDANDEPASELLKRIAKEKARLVKAGEIRKFVGPEAVPVQDQPFNVPQNWEWVRLGDVLTKLTDGTHHSPPNGPVGDFKYITAKNIKNEGVLLDDVSYVSREVHEEIFARCNPAKGDILYIKDGATTGVVTINDLDEPFSMLSSVALLKLPSFLFNRLVVEFLRSPFFYDQMRGFMKGAAITRVTLKRMGPALLSLPPLAEQHRIVAKVDELMGLCDRLAAARAGRETARDRLAAASIARLNATDPETFREDARFALDALPALTTRPDQIKRLRQTILNLAVRGKLVPQDANDEPASELLKRIAKEKARAGKREKVEADIDNEEELGDLPPTWRAVPLIALGSWAIGSGFPKNEQGFESGPHFFLKVSDMNLPGNEKYITTSNNFIDDDAARRMRAKIHPPGTIIFPKIGGAIATNKRRILNRGSAIDNNCLGITFSSALNVEWAFLLLTTLDFTRYQAGTAVPALQQSVLERIPVGLPPLAEQHRIVAKVDALMALCDRLEASLTAAGDTRRRLLDALLAEALAPADARELEAAE
ncbi:MAG: restriction endonuclease subunit S [Rhizobiales bacterium]|nr:restriction endonuclease subunit S [Hyphomicrobiales bacterium]